MTELEDRWEEEKEGKKARKEEGKERWRKEGTGGWGGNFPLSTEDAWKQ